MEHSQLMANLTESDIFRIVVQEWKEQAESLHYETAIVSVSLIL